MLYRIFRVVSRFPRHFVLYLGVLDYFLDSVGGGHIYSVKDVCSCRDSIKHTPHHSNLSPFLVQEKLHQAWKEPDIGKTPRLIYSVFLQENLQY